MECEPKELQFLGIAGIYCEAVLILRAHRPLFARIAAAFVLPLSLLFLLHIAISHALFSHIDSDDHALDSAAPGTPTQRRLPRRSVANPLSSRVDGCDLPESKWTQTSPSDPLGSYNDAEWRDWANLGTELTEDIIGRLLALDPMEYIHWIRKEEKGKLSFEGREQGGERDELERAWEKNRAGGEMSG